MPSAKMAACGLSRPSRDVIRVLLSLEGNVESPIVTGWPHLAIVVSRSPVGKMSAGGEVLERMVVSAEMSGSSPVAAVPTSTTSSTTAAATSTVTAGGGGVGDEEEEWLYGGTGVCVGEEGLVISPV